MFASILALAFQSCYLENDGDFDANPYVVIAVVTTMMAVKWLAGIHQAHTLSVGQRARAEVGWRQIA